MEKQMNIKRAFIVLMTLAFMPSLVMAQLTPAPDTAVMIVNKVFDDGNNETPVTLRMQCLTGNPTQQEVTVSHDTVPTPYEAGFVLDNIPTEGATCTVTEVPVPGYTGDYWCDPQFQDSTVSTASGDCGNLSTGSFVSCEWTNVVAGDINRCTVVNRPDAVQITVEKEWVTLGAESQRVKEETDIEIRCDNNAVILGPSAGQPSYKYYTKSKGSTTKFVAKDIEGDATIKVDVIPGFKSSSCSADESIRDSAVEKTGNCGSMTISAGSGDSCKMTNTVFFEGIPTLSQYGMAIMALLMLGVGFVGFRRFV